MDKYQIQWRYASSLGGPWKEGQILELTEAEAEALNRDSPGVVVRHVVKRKTRQVRKARVTRKAGG